MDQRTQPLFFAFETKSKPGKLIGHCVRVETIELDGDVSDATQFTLFPAGWEDDKRIRQLLCAAYRFITENKIDPNTLLK